MLLISNKECDGVMAYYKSQILKEMCSYSRLTLRPGRKTDYERLWIKQNMSFFTDSQPEGLEL